jgi:hypothetical protein
MFQESAVGPVTSETRTAIPQISAHLAKNGSREYVAGPSSWAPATLAVCSWGFSPLPAFVFPQDRFAVKYADNPSGVKSSWSRNGGPCAGSKQVICSGGSEKG